MRDVSLEAHQAFSHLIQGEDMKYNSIEDDLQYVIDMYWRQEFNHWEELGNPDDHIFNNLNNIKNFLIGRQND